MKKIVKIFTGLVVVSFVFFNLSVLDTVGITTNLNLDKLRIQLAHSEAGGGIGEVTITCSTSGYGKCWDEDCHITWTPLGGYNTTYCPSFTGYQNDICVPELPC